MPKLLNLTQSLPRRRGRDRQSQRHSHAELDETLEDNLERHSPRELDSCVNVTSTRQLVWRVEIVSISNVQKAFAVTFPLDAPWAPGRQKNFQGNGIGNSGRWSMRTGRRGRVIAILSEGREGQKSENGAGVRVCIGDVWQVAMSRGEEPGLREGG